MIKSYEDYVFPHVVDIEGLIGEKCHGALRGLLRDRGVLIYCKKDELAEKVGMYAFDETFYSKLFAGLERMAIGVSISGTRFRADEEDSVLDAILEESGAGACGVHSARILREASNVAEHTYEFDVQYVKINAKFASYSRRQTHHLKATMRLIKGDLYEIVCQPRSSSDSMVLRDTVERILSRCDGKPVGMDLASLPLDDRVRIFDGILDQTAKRKWRVEEASGLSIRSSAGKGGEQDQDLPDSDQAVLHSAILEGRRLRGNPIVVSLVEKGFYFYTAVIHTWRDKTGLGKRIRVKVDFKKSPGVFVVTALDVRTLDTDEVQWHTSAVDQETGGECARYYWNLVHELFSDCVARAKSKARKVQRDDGASDGAEQDA